MPDDAGPMPDDAGPMSGDAGPMPGDAGGQLPGDGGPGDDAASDGAVTPPTTPPNFAQACGFDAFTVIQDGDLFDYNSGTVLAVAIQGNCLASNSRSYVSQDDPGVLDATTHRPLTPASELLVLAGSPVPQRAVAYLNIADAPVVSRIDDNNHYELSERATGNVILSEHVSAFTLTRDVAVLMAVYEPIDRTTAIVVYGNEQMGTAAGAHWFAQLLPEPLRTSTKHWYVVEWVERDSIPGPSSGDRFTVLGSG